MMDIRELAKEFTSKAGNSIVSQEILLNFYKFVESRTNAIDPYEEIALVCDLRETDTKDCYVERGTLSYFTKTKYGFIDIRSDYQK